MVRLSATNGTLCAFIRQLPDLIESRCTEQLLKTTEQLSHDVWQLPEFRRTLQQIANRDRLSARFFLFIDGLDKFEEAHLEFRGILSGAIWRYCARFLFDKTTHPDISLPLIPLLTSCDAESELEREHFNEE